MPRRHGRGPCHYLWDGDVVDTPDERLFDPDAWRRDQALVGQASGRGTAYFLQADAHTQWVLRHSRRGGLVANISDDHYLWLGLARCRVFQEWRLLASLREQGLPVPAPIAARVVRHGLCYSGDLITRCVPAAQPLSDWLAAQPLSATAWRAIGTTVARFHDAGVYHHDLNARNILLDAAGTITLIDFDKSRLRTPGQWCWHNIERLRRSLDKIAAAQPGLHFVDTDWAALLGGYDAEEAL